MLKIGQMMLDKGLWHGRQIVSREWVERSTTQRTRSGDYPYGFYWHLSGPEGPTWRGPSAFMAIGQAGQYIIVCPEAETVVVVTSANWQPGGTRLAMSALINKFIAPSIR